MVTAIDRIELLRLIEEEHAEIVDVLPAPEYAESHVPGAINMPLKRLDAESASVVSRDKPVVVY